MHNIDTIQSSEHIHQRSHVPSGTWRSRIPDGIRRSHLIVSSVLYSKTHLVGVFLLCVYNLIMEKTYIFYYVYVLLSKNDGKFYIGFTEDLKRRFEQHNKGESPATKCRRPFELIFYEAYRNKYDALRREKYFKSTKGKTTLNTMLTEFLENDPS